MRQHVDREKLTEFMRSLGSAATGPGRVYLVGGATALLLGVRPQTIDIDIKMSPEPTGAFEAIAAIKNALDVSVELAAPDDFLPALSGWVERSEFIARYGEIDFFHYDFYAQALSKLLRGHDKDIDDVRALVQKNLVDPPTLLELFEEARPRLNRYPAIDEMSFEQRVRDFVESL